MDQFFIRSELVTLCPQSRFPVNWWDRCYIKCFVKLLAKVEIMNNSAYRIKRFIVTSVKINKLETVIKYFIIRLLYLAVLTWKSILVLIYRVQSQVTLMRHCLNIPVFTFYTWALSNFFIFDLVSVAREWILSRSSTKKVVENWQERALIIVPLLHDNTRQNRELMQNTRSSLFLCCETIKTNWCFVNNGR